MVHFLEKTSVLVEKGRKKYTMCLHSSFIFGKIAKQKEKMQQSRVPARFLLFKSFKVSYNTWVPIVGEEEKEEEEEEEEEE